MGGVLAGATVLMQSGEPDDPRSGRGLVIEAWIVTGLLMLAVAVPLFG